jgi:DNA-binding CsgD family transcriptional regulator
VAALAALLRAEATGNPAVRIYQPEVTGAAGWVAAAQGEHERARGLVSEAAEAAAGHETWAVEASLRHDVARLGAPEAVADRLSALAALTGLPLVDAYARHARGLAGRDPALLEEAALDFERAGAVLLAAEAHAAAAPLFRQEGLRASEMRAAGRAQAARALCQGATTPALALAQGPDELALLTRREREVVSLAGRGVPNREIAAQLGLSVRTVANHLNRAYAKLGVSGRAEVHDLNL